MKYMIMECHRSYAVALDEEGRFLRVANMHFEIGQQVEEVIVYSEKPIVSMQKRLISYASMVACLLCVMIGSLQLFVLSYGNVHLRINPEIDLSVNRLCYITKLEGVNQDGRLLLQGYSYRGKKVEQVLKELTEKAMEDGYLAEGGEVYVDVDSVHMRWKQKHLDGLAKSMSEHFENKIQILSNTTEQAMTDKRESDKQDTVKKENSQNKNHTQMPSGYESSKNNETKNENMDAVQEKDIQKSTQTSSYDSGNKNSHAAGSDGQQEIMKGNTPDDDDDDDDDADDKDDDDDDDADDKDDDTDDDDDRKQSSAGHKIPPKDSHASDTGNQQQKEEEPDDREESNKDDDNDDDNDNEEDSGDDDDSDDDDHDDEDD